MLRRAVLLALAAATGGAAAQSVSLQGSLGANKALLVIEVQKKVATLLGLASADDSAGST